MYDARYDSCGNLDDTKNPDSTAKVKAVDEAALFATGFLGYDMFTGFDSNDFTFKSSIKYAGQVMCYT